jgi:LmbE family N-acetylglucosaminyl deacetylase
MSNAVKVSMNENVGYDSIYLSPHLDDVVLSCGGQIYAATQRSERVLIVTITAGDPHSAISDFAASLHSRWKLTDATESRRQEDLAASTILGATALHWNIPDCIYRTDNDGNPFYVSEDDIFGAVAPQEMFLVNDLAAQMRALPVARQVVMPLAVGEHVDHQLTRLAAEQAFVDESRVTLLYYEYCPYAQWPGALEQMIVRGMRAGVQKW